jgi:hypothetical protein
MQIYYKTKFSSIKIDVVAMATKVRIADDEYSKSGAKGTLTS